MNVDAIYKHNKTKHCRLDRGEQINEEIRVLIYDTQTEEKIIRRLTKQTKKMWWHFKKRKGMLIRTGKTSW